MMLANLHERPPRNSRVPFRPAVVVRSARWSLIEILLGIRFAGAVLSVSSFWSLQAISLKPTAQALQKPKVPGRCFGINHRQRRSGLSAYGLAFILEQFDQVADGNPGRRSEVSQGCGSFCAYVLVFVLQGFGKCRYSHPGRWADFPQSRGSVTAEILVLGLQGPSQGRHRLPGFPA
jgi:hypothetical protein